MKILPFCLIIILGCNPSAENKLKGEETDTTMSCPIGICGVDNNKVSFEEADLFFTKGNLRKVGTINYLGYLKNFSCYELELPVCRFPENCVRADEIDTLNILLSDKTPCPGIFIPSAYSRNSNLDSSYIPSSTIGKEALRLLNSFYLHRYPCFITYDSDSLRTLLEHKK